MKVTQHKQINSNNIGEQYLRFLTVQRNKGKGIYKERIKKGEKRQENIIKNSDMSYIRLNLTKRRKYLY